MKIWQKIIFYASKHSTHPEEIGSMAAIMEHYSEIRAVIFCPQTSEMGKFYCGLNIQSQILQ
jgi:hypothetical protein